jgi:hypothetical protein
MSSNEYFLAWSIYIGSSFFVLIFWCWVTSPIKSLTLRLLLRLPALAILLTPIQHIADHSLYVPTVAAVAFNLIAKDSTALANDASILIAAVAVSLFVALLLGFLGHILSRFFSNTETES